MARSLAPSRAENDTPMGIRGLFKSFGVAAAGALGTVLVTTGLPSLSTHLWKQQNNTTLSPEAIAFQQKMWIDNSQCGVSPAGAIWHDGRDDLKVDATICPRTGDIMVTMRDIHGKLLQSWVNLTDLRQQFSQKVADADTSPFTGLLVERAFAADRKRLRVSYQSQLTDYLAQMVMCQIFLPDGRGLRRRLVVGPNQCVEILIDTFTGQVVYQRPIPCVPNCAQNV